MADQQMAHASNTAQALQATSETGHSTGPIAKEFHKLDLSALKVKTLKLDERDPDNPPTYDELFDENMRLRDFHDTTVPNILSVASMINDCVDMIKIIEERNLRNEKFINESTRLMTQVQESMAAREATIRETEKQEYDNKMKKLQAKHAAEKRQSRLEIQSLRQKVVKLEGRLMDNSSTRM
ncbi:hypothetical protein LQV05_003176 [Cryptococcus neoformans]|nr:hypothetical protein C356_05597 [Cryptococcus neoformans var. grubii c45]OXB34789.1 hypothetical protein J007_05521 [Cryptococcus neoformans var. grubii]OXC58912.1 hypothetical protein C358_05640 [Cryptococcus neoformans var. grubii MW-RSA852]UOH80522.1 hypothetical protein LQV05_003176 [Cryptococcus neoformans]